MSHNRILILLAIIALFIGGFLLWQQNRAPFVVYEDFNDYLEAETPNEREIERYTKNLQKAYAEDEYGGVTPQETLDLFVAALKGGDTGLAAKYFILEKQKRIAEELAVGKENGVLELLISDINRADSGYALSETKYEFNTFDENNVNEFNFNLVLNEHTSKWKIESL